MNKNYFRVAAILAAVSLSSLAAATASASASAGSDQFCVVMVGASVNPSTASPVEYSYCSAISAADARDHMNSRQSARSATPASALSSDLLMTWYTDIDYGTNVGPATQIFGSAGPCDSACYRIAPSSYWATNMSSIQGNGNCNTVRLTTRSGTYSETRQLPANQLGSTLNDNVGLTNVYQG